MPWTSRVSSTLFPLSLQSPLCPKASDTTASVLCHTGGVKFPAEHHLKHSLLSRIAFHTLLVLLLLLLTFLLILQMPQLKAQNLCL
ncbi:hypothetical protein K402DRAFT_398115 [Aulographum hederae CBS 113979]|uniref:Uncharacterized protein n=1 Tax=Aulographum hederae CBS 113979 TaxID=1176131 RepID=A0A6G1GLM9_9PEZI|nr:hypothetical protein K402DRAFT_398115 [Aulographum hederae CBS 113979]